MKATEYFSVPQRKLSENVCGQSERTWWLDNGVADSAPFKLNLTFLPKGGGGGNVQSPEATLQGRGEGGGRETEL